MRSESEMVKTSAFFLVSILYSVFIRFFLISFVSFFFFFVFLSLLPSLPSVTLFSIFVFVFAICLPFFCVCVYLNKCVGCSFSCTTLYHIIWENEVMKLACSDFKMESVWFRSHEHGGTVTVLPNSDVATRRIIIVQPTGTAGRDVLHGTLLLLPRA